jgi:hypothetical protein
MNSNQISEKQLHLIWQKNNFNSDLTTSTEDRISILSTGEYNQNSSGPDFKHARIQIGSLTFVGDVEIDMDYSDWKNHGHNINKNYNKVILHICFTNKQKQNYVYTSDGRKVNSISIKDNISIDDLTSEITLAVKSIAKTNNELKCHSEIEIVEKNEIEKFLLKLGIERFQQKCDKVYDRLKELKFISELELKEPVIRYELTKQFNERNFSHSDFKNKTVWKQLLYEMIFEALGYSKNKMIMKKLAQNIQLEFFNNFEKDDKFLHKIESIYYNVSGLLNYDELSTDNYIKELNSIWQTYSKIYDGKKFDETQWHFLGQRPQNFPTVRIAGGARLVDEIVNNNLVGKIIKKFSEITNTKVLINSIRSLFIIKAQGYWSNHYIFKKESKIKLNYIVGLSRADEIFVNVLLPFLSVYFDMFGNETLSKKVLKVFNEFEQKLDNKIVRDISDNLLLNGMNKKAIYSQGMIELYRNYCTKNKCLECEIGKKVFN